MAAHARLKNEFTEVKKYHNLTSWLNFITIIIILTTRYHIFTFTCLALFHFILCYRSECFPIDIPGDDPYFNNSCMNFVRSLPATNQPCGQGKSLLTASVWLLMVDFFSSDFALKSNIAGTYASLCRLIIYAQKA